MATYSGWFDPNLWRQALGNTVDELATAAKVPWDTGISEWIAGGNTTNTGTKYSTQAYTPAPAPMQTMDTMSHYYPSADPKPKTTTQPTTTSGGSSGSSGDPQRDAFNSVLAAGGYAGWDPNAAWEDFKATGGPRIGSSSGDDAERARREQEARDNISRGYDEYENRLRGMEGYFNTRQAEDLGLLDQNYATIQSGLQDQYGNTLQKIEGNRGQVRQNAANSIEDLRRNLNDTVRGMSMQLGAMGAGDTSAARVMMPYAYTKLAGVQEGGIQRQLNDQLFQLQQDELDTENQFNTLMNQTELEKQNGIRNIRDTYGSYIAQVRQAIAQAPAERAKALQGLLEGLLGEAQNRLAILEAEDRAYKRQIQDWAQGRMAELNNMKLEIANSANFNPQDIVFNELQMANAAGGMSAGGDTFWNPMALAQRRRKQLGL